MKEMVVEPISVRDLTGKLHVMLQGKCPYCSNKHIYSNGLGHRVAHCLNANNEGYELVLRSKINA